MERKWRVLFPGTFLLLFLSFFTLYFTACTNPAGTEPAGPEPGGYTVTFALNNGTEAAHAVKTVTPPAATVTDFPANPVRSGYAFTGWNTQANGSGSAFTASTTVSANLTVYAQWTAVPAGSHLVTFTLNDGTEANHTVKIVTPPAATVTEFPANPTRTGYTFTGWNTQANGSGSAFTASTTVSGSITVYAQWTGETYTVTFDNDGGDTAASPATKTVTRPAAAIDSLPAQPSKTGYVFGGWYTGPDGKGSAFTASTTVNGNITVYALWTAIPAGSHTVTFRLNAGTESEGVHAVKPVTSPATTVTDFPGDPVNMGYAFGGWYTEPDGGGTAFTASTTVSGDRTVYAKWNTYSYTVTFDDNGGDPAENPGADPVTTTVASPATTVDSLPAQPAKTGYAFGGWYTERDGGGTAFTASTTVSGNITVYAGWDTYSYTVTFDNDGITTATKTVASPATTIDSLPVPPAKTDYIFAGWNTQADGSGTPFTVSAAVSGDITVYALWIPEQFDITLNPDAGEGAFTQASFTLSKSAAGSQNIIVTGTGYTNPRWYVDDNLKGTENSVTINAADYGAGRHLLALIISKGGVSWSKEITFTVTN